MRWCCKQVYVSGGSSMGHACGKRVKHELDGLSYCALHYPPNEAARSAARREKWNTKWGEKKAAQKKSNIERDERDRKAACFDDLLSTLRIAKEALINANQSQPCPLYGDACLAVVAAIARVEAK